MDLFNPIKPTVLLVDASPANLSLLGKLLHHSYTVKAINHGAQALKIAYEEQPDLILLDIMMPDMDGYDVCRQLKAATSTCHIPVIFLTSKTEVRNAEMGMALGAVDYITQPINPAILLSRVRAHMGDALNTKTLRVNNAHLEYEVGKRARQLAALQQTSILAMSALAEVRDVDTGNHLRRTQNYIRALGKQLQGHPRFSDFLSDEMIDIVFKCAPLHDIGKVGIPDRILLKPGRYEPQEFAIMKTHPQLGWDALNKAQDAAGEAIEFLEIAKQIVLSHHEKWNGSGYPQGLAGDDIPIPARLMALADVYDALISPRVYKAGMSHFEAMQIIMAGSGTHFDPDVVNAFLAVNPEFETIAIRFADQAEELAFKASTLNMMLDEAD